jgi:hypothetical protein
LRPLFVKKMSAYAGFAAWMLRNGNINPDTGQRDAARLGGVARHFDRFGQRWTEAAHRRG